jgi:hypothetical protein
MLRKTSKCIILEKLFRMKPMRFLVLLFLIPGFVFSQYLTKHGEISNSTTDNINKYGELGAIDGLTSSGASVTVSISHPDGSSSSQAAPSAEAILQHYPTSPDGVYWIDLPTNGPTETYCLMDSAYNGGGWMLAMKATRGTTFNYDANYWTTSNTLNPSDLTRADADAKYDAMNKFLAQDVMAIWPDISANGGESGSIDGLSNWTWLENNFHNNGTRISLISKFGGPQDTFYTSTNGSMSFSGYKSDVFTSQAGFTFYGFNYTVNAANRVRWGFAWNNESNQNSNDVSGGIGMKRNSYSAGDSNNCCGSSNGINRTARVEIYIR